MNAKHIAYANGAIRNAAGQLIAFYDADNKIVHINGVAQGLFAADIEAALELVGQYA